MDIGISIAAPPPPPPCKTCQSLRELGNKGVFVCLFFYGHHDDIGLDHIVRGGVP